MHKHNKIEDDYSHASSSQSSGTSTSSCAAASPPVDAPATTVAAAVVVAIAFTPATPGLKPKVCVVVVALVVMVEGATLPGLLPGLLKPPKPLLAPPSPFPPPPLLLPLLPPPLPRTTIVRGASDDCTAAGGAPAAAADHPRNVELDVVEVDAGVDGLAGVRLNGLPQPPGVRAPVSGFGANMFADGDDDAAEGAGGVGFPWLSVCVPDGEAMYAERRGWGMRVSKRRMSWTLCYDLA